MPTLNIIRASGPAAISYFVLASLTASLTRYGDGVAFIWVANALLVARLATIPRRSWMVNMAMCGTASAAATSFFGLGLAAAVPMALVNVLEAFVAASLLRRISIPEEPMGSLRWFVVFVLVVGLIAPASAAIGAAAIASLAGGGGLTTNALRWFAGHALGALTFTPIFMLVFRSDLHTAWARRRKARVVEGVALISLVTATSVAVFAQRGLPLLFLPLLPVILATFRGGRSAASVSVVMLVLVGGTFTLAGRGPIMVIDGTVGDRMQFLQFYLAATVLTVLPIAADLARRGALYRNLRDSEARYRLLADNSTDIILNLDVRGRIRFVSPSITQLGGYSPGPLIGTKAVDLVAPAYRGAVLRSHVAALRSPGETACVEYKATTQSGDIRWFETRSRAVQSAASVIEGVVCIIRDIEERKLEEGRLSNAAHSDSLTGLLNRRAFDARLKQAAFKVAAERLVGCVALFDIDFFKRVNDTFGHAAGDRVIQHFAGLALATVRTGDFVARIGGEEFALLMLNATVEQATSVCDRLCLAASSSVVEDAGRKIRITVSGGVAPLMGGEERQVLRDADAALYNAKNAGRNRFLWAA